MSERVPVTFSPAGITVWVERGVTVLQAARRAGVVLPAPCGGRGVCGACGVRVLAGSPAPVDEIEKRGLASAPPGVRLACRALIDGPLEVRPLVNRQVAAVPGGEPVADESLVAGVDLGTTTVSAVIVGHSSGRELGRATVANTQSSWGSDVLSRISAALSGSASELHTAAEESVLAALRAACTRSGTCLGGIERLVVVGNTAMIALLSRADVSSLASAPFSAPPGMGQLVAGGRLSAALAPGCDVELLEPIASFVGGDVSAGLLAAGLVDQDGVALLVDIGTNAEIAVVSPTGLVVSSAAAGPAFEGFGISSGGAWAAGAVERVAMGEQDLVIDVAGGGEPQWLCGSGLVTAIATLRRAGHIAVDGRMAPEGPLAGRFVTRDGILGIALGREGGRPHLMQTDVRAFQSAKAAVAAGIVSTVSSARVKPAAIRRFCVAGAFGGSLTVADLVELGVVPADLESAFEEVGDAAMLGSAMLAFDASLGTDLAALIAGAHHVELAADPSFGDSFVAHTGLEPFRLGGRTFGWRR